MNFKSSSSDNVFIRMLFRHIDSIFWQNFELRVSFKGRRMAVGIGNEARDFVVELVERKEIEYLSPREEKEIEWQQKKDHDHINRMRGAKKNSENWARKRRMKALKLRSEDCE